MGVIDVSHRAPNRLLNYCLCEVWPIEVLAPAGGRDGGDLTRGNPTGLQTNHMASLMSFHIKPLSASNDVSNLHFHKNKRYEMPSWETGMFVHYIKLCEL